MATDRDIAVIPLLSTLESSGFKYHTSESGLLPAPSSLTYLHKAREIGGWPFHIQADESLYHKQRAYWQNGQIQSAWRTMEDDDHSYEPVLEAILRAPTERVLITMATGNIAEATHALGEAFEIRARTNPALAAKKIILTGAMKPLAGWGGTRDAQHRLTAVRNAEGFEETRDPFGSNERSHLGAYRTSDGYQNLIYSVERLQDDAIGPGVYAAMHGRLYEPGQFRKNWSKLMYEGASVHEDHDVILPTRTRINGALQAVSVQEVLDGASGNHVTGLLRRAVQTLLSATFSR